MIKAATTLGAFAFVVSAAMAQTAPVPDDVHLERTGAGTYIQSAVQQSLYYNGREDVTGEISCIEECLESWFPLRPSADARSQGDWTIVQRPDEGTQWAYQGKPLYTYIKDTFPGARLGDGASREQWQIVFELRDVPPGMKIESTLLGQVLTEHRGRTLYTRSAGNGQDAQAAPSQYWKAFEAPWLALDQGDWTIETIAERARQWSYKGQPLYTYDKDNDPQDIHGHGLDGQWSAVILEPAPALPSWITVQQVDLGLAYADADGMTLYAPVDINAIKAAQTCPEACMKENWRPILPKPGEQSVGNWVIVENDDGQMQWSYKGELLYTHTRDEKPGDMKGNGIAVGYRIGDGWRIIPVDRGLRRSRS